MTTKHLDWTVTVWRALCLVTALSALVAIILWDLLPPLMQGVLVTPGLIVTLLIVVARFVDSSHTSGIDSSATKRSGSNGVAR